MSRSVAWVLFPTMTVVSLGSSAVLVTRLERVAARLGLREATLGLVAALAADGPEISSAVTGLIRGQHEVGLGVVLGSNVFNLAALLGLSALVSRRIRLHRDVVVFAGVPAVGLMLVAVGATAGVLVPGLALGFGLVVVVPYVVISSLEPGALGRVPLPGAFTERLSRAIADEEAELRDAVHPAMGRPLDVVVAAVALCIVIASSAVLEHAATAIGGSRVPAIVIGGVVLAAVTSLPNAVAAVYLARRGRGSAVLSEALNSNSFNVLFGLLVPTVILGAGASGGVGLEVALWYGGLSVVALALAYRSRGLTRTSGVVVVCGYLAFVGVLVAR